MLEKAITDSDKIKLVEKNDVLKTKQGYQTVFRSSHFKIDDIKKIK